MGRDCMSPLSWLNVRTSGFAEAADRSSASAKRAHLSAARNADAPGLPAWGRSQPTSCGRRSTSVPSARKPWKCSMEPRHVCAHAAAGKSANRNKIFLLFGAALFRFGPPLHISQGRVMAARWHSLGQSVWVRLPPLQPPGFAPVFVVLVDYEPWGLVFMLAPTSK